MKASSTQGQRGAGGRAGDNLNKGLNWTAATTAEAITERCLQWGIKAKGVADDACFAKSGYSSEPVYDL